MKLCSACKGTGMLANDICVECDGEGVDSNMTFVRGKITRRSQPMEFSEHQAKKEKTMKLDKKNAVRGE